MSLDALSQEIWVNILSHVGTAYFRQDVRRLTVSRKWYNIAWPVLFQDCEFTSESLVTFLGKCKDKGFRELIQRYLQSVHLSLNGFTSTKLPSSSPSTDPSDPSVPTNDAETRQNAWEWTGQLGDNQVKLADILKGCKKLHSLGLVAKPEGRDPDVGLTDRPYLMLLPLWSLLASTSNVTSLIFDTGGSSIIPILKGGETSHLCTHLCAKISQMYPNLRQLRCRMNTICPKVLTPPEDSKDLPLEEVVINLRLKEDDGALGRPSQCFSSRRRVGSQLAALLEKAAKDLVPYLRNPKMVRLMYPALDMYTSDTEIHCYNALTGERRRLRETDAWDAEGEALNTFAYFASQDNKASTG